MSSRIIVIDDESSMLAVIEAMLTNQEYDVVTFENPEAGIEDYKAHGADLIISDIRMDSINGITLLQRVREINPDALVILITAYANAEDALQALKIGAYDYIQKPFKMEKLRSLVTRALTVNNILKANRAREKEGLVPGEEEVSFCGIDSRNKVMKKLFEYVKKAAPSKSTILLQGESGTGKELFAKSIHLSSGRANEPFVPINCGALPEHLLETELFGHVKGSFTGAIKDKEGLFQAAGDGTLFLDEISSLSLNLQSKLLRVLEEREIRAVGGIKTEKINCRVVAATNISLEELIEKRTFREDLYYRLNVIPIEIPPLRERPEDIMLLIRLFLKKYAPGKEIIISPAAMNILLEYHWPGNVRELENTIERITTLYSGHTVTPEDLPQFVQKDSIFSSIDKGDAILPMKQFAIMADGQYILSVLKKVGDDRNQAAEKLGINIYTLNRKLERFERLQNP